MTKSPSDPGTGEAAADATCWLEAAPEEARAHLEKLLAQPSVGPGDLRVELDRYLDRLEEHRDEYEFLDIGAARALVAQCGRLLEWLAENHTPERNRLVQAAVRYVIKSNDAESDLSSPIGYEDDTEVVEATAKTLGRPDLLNAR